MKRLAGAVAPTLGVCILYAAIASVVHAAPQVIEFESNGLKYQTLTRSGVTVMCAVLPARLREFAIIQISVANGSAGPYVIRPEDFSFARADGRVVRAASADTVVRMISQRGARSDILSLTQIYEAALYGHPKMRSTNGYEQRRQAALMFGPTKIRAAAAASAVALVATKLLPGQSTDGAVFIPIEASRPLGPGHLVVKTNTDTFEFNSE
jgi:hypothetical protein